MVNRLVGTCLDEQNYLTSYENDRLRSQVLLDLMVGLLISISQFVPNAPFLYPPENIRKPYGFLMFSGGRESVHWEQIV